jgi:hypothetical protein
MAKKRTTVKRGPSRRPKKKSRLDISQMEHQNQVGLKKVFSKIADHKGFSSQDRFERIFTDYFEKPSWFVSIRKATQYEDHFEGTDFFILTNHYGEIRFDVKSSFHNFDKQRREQEGLPIFVWGIVIKPHFSDEEIRQAVFSKCEIHIVRFKREVRMGRIPARTA